MNSEQNKRLRGLLWDLVRIQDNITHLNEAGVSSAIDRKYFENEKADRHRKIEEILAFVDSIEQD